MKKQNANKDAWVHFKFAVKLTVEVPNVILDNKVCCVIVVSCLYHIRM